MSIQMRGDRVGVQKVGKSNDQSTGIIMPEVADSLGIIRYIGDGADEDLKVGTKVYYGNKRQQIQMGGADIEVMESENVFALVKETLDDKTSTPKQA